jgi:DNA segregation ATPase FtsK/SpoIIIE, S-DNA-T family
VSDKTDMKASRSLRIMAELQHAAESYSVQEEQLRSEYATKKFQLERKHRNVSEDHTETLAERVAAIRAEHETWEQRVHNNHASRRERINKAQRTGNRDLHKRAEEVRERWLGSLQVKKINIERRAAQSVKLAEVAYQKVESALSERGASLVEMDRLAKVSLSGFSGLRDLFRRQKGDAVATAVPEQLLPKIDAGIAAAAAEAAELKRLMLPKLFSGVGLMPMILLAVVVGVIVAAALGLTSQAVMMGGGLVVCLSLLLTLLWAIGRSQAQGPAHVLATTLADTVRLHEDASASAKARLAAEKTAAEQKKEVDLTDINAEWEKADRVKGDYEATMREKLRVQVPRAWGKNDVHLNLRVDFIRAHCAAEIARLTDQTTAHHDKLVTARDADLQKLNGEMDAKWTALVAQWRTATETLYAGVAEMNAVAAAHPPAWTLDLASNWSPPDHFESATRFARLELTLSADARPKDPRLALPGPETVSLPVALAFPHEGSLLIETSESGTPEVVGTLNHLVFRLFATTPPGKIAITVIDPVGLGQNFAGLMHLGDYEDTLINRRIWTQRDQIEDRLQELNEHIEKVIQMYLRNEYATITEYNEQAGSVAEKYHFLVIADFPAGFSESAVKRLQSIAASGPRCGVFTLLHWDKRQPSPDGLVAEELRKASVVMTRTKQGMELTAEGLAQGAAKLLLDAPPADEVAVELVHKIGKASIDSNRVEVPFVNVAPAPEAMWTDDTAQELRVAIGRTGATKLQYLAIGKGTKQHALFAGKTGSGKSTLFHVIITNLALHCDPEQVEFYLIDFKKGVEFKCYATKKLPHARVVAIESDREFGLSVLQRVDEELKRRGDLFRKMGVQDLAGYKRAGGKEAIPRTLLMIDEFQEFFVDDDAVAQSASLLFDRIVRQGRAFGIHVLLGSQTLGGAYTLARATLGQMVIRVALQCNEADAYLIMDESNPAPRLLTRPGEGIYNDAAGALEGNSPFQVVWLPDEERDAWLDQVSALSQRSGKHHPSPIVFEGNAPAEIAENDSLLQALQASPTRLPSMARCWLGAPNSIKGPTEAALQRQSGNHVLIVGQREEAALAMVGSSILSLAAQFPKAGAKFYVLHASTAGSSEERFLAAISAAVPQPIKLLRGAELSEMMNEVAEIQKDRATSGHEEEPSVFVFVVGMQRFKKLRQEDDFSFSLGGDSDSGGNPAAQLADLITEGSALGLHLISTVDTYNNVSRFLSRKALSEIELRVLFQMSANDSASLIESPKASELGLHRAIFYNQQEGIMETFRPYALPDEAWIATITHQLHTRL